MEWKPRKDVNKWRSIVDKCAVEFQVSQALILSVIQMESGGDKNAFRYEPGFYKYYLENNATWQNLMIERNYTEKQVSSSYGLMQLMYPTAWMLGFREDPEELYNPYKNIHLGTKYLKQLLDKYDGNHFLALAHYNGGSTGAKQYINNELNQRPARYANKANQIYENFVNYHKKYK
jgi:soluble lytic murein transglycosylase-like protein